VDLKAQQVLQVYDELKEVYTTRLMDSFSCVAFGTESAAHLFDVQTGQQLQRFGMDSYVFGILCPEPDQLIVACGDGEISHFDLRSGAEPIRSIQPHEKGVHHLSHLPKQSEMHGGTYLFATASGDNTTKLLEWPRLTEVAHLKGAHTRMLSWVGELPSDGTIVTGSMQRCQHAHAYGTHLLFSPRLRLSSLSTHSFLCGVHFCFPCLYGLQVIIMTRVSLSGMIRV
jgi:WD40 repeat protein